MLQPGVELRRPAVMAGQRQHPRGLALRALTTLLPHPSRERGAGGREHVLAPQTAPCSRLPAPSDSVIPTSTRSPPTRAVNGGTSRIDGSSHAITLAPTGSPSAATFTVVARKCRRT